ncbi:MAG: 2-oxo acid dehydrogenase subunit E2 [Syntrophobacteraceae bacterium]|jgi:pyruvate dehydrogenase E2 component (dihydrolipoamide acetyltransferase)|nr:2-oxo acid dehydrogenase subunit E2 [Syntrophobacteraceae bacterium]
MPVEFKLPDLGEGIHEGEIIDVLVAVGDTVEDGQPILVVETDKATTEVPAPVTGKVAEILVKPGDEVKVGQVLMTFSTEDERRVTRPAVEGPPKKGVEAPAEPSPEPPPGKAGERDREEAAPKGEEAPRSAAPPGPVPATPSTRRLARELGVDIRGVIPSGPGGRVTAEDVRAFAEQGGKPAEKPEAPPAAERGEIPLAPAVISRVEVEDHARWGPVERIPLKSIRRATARHMALAWSQIPHVAHQDVADITELEAFRRRHKAGIEDRGGALSLTVFALKAAVAALKAHPRFNASLDTAAEEIVLKQYVHIGVAVDSDRGLIVPVIRDVDRKSVTELAIELLSLAERTREGKTQVEELQGGSFTITNIGVLGGTGFNPIINFPQVAILGLAQARWQSIVRGRHEPFEIVPRLMLPLILGFDHRVVDGADAARFLNRVKENLEDPEKLLLV